MIGVVIERCQQCGFDGSKWDIATALKTLEAIPDTWAMLVNGLSFSDLQKRPDTSTWSIAEYTDHVCETTFGMRFLIDVAIDMPDLYLGTRPSPRLDETARAIDTNQVLKQFRSEVALLVNRAASLRPDQWNAVVEIDDTEVDVLWIIRHAVHDLSHHVGDIGRIIIGLIHSGEATKGD
jgi:DinB superfamily